MLNIFKSIASRLGDIIHNTEGKRYVSNVYMSQKRKDLQDLSDLRIKIKNVILKGDSKIDRVIRDVSRVSSKE